MNADANGAANGLRKRKEIDYLLAIMMWASPLDRRQQNPNFQNSVLEGWRAGIPPSYDSFASGRRGMAATLHQGHRHEAQAVRSEVGDTRFSQNG